jgi:hypothetical protein
MAGCAASKVDSDARAMALILMFQVVRWVFDVFAWILARTVLLDLSTFFFSTITNKINSKHLTRI